jgi:hypothetical protein
MYDKRLRGYRAFGYALKTEDKNGDLNLAQGFAVSGA